MCRRCRENVCTHSTHEVEEGVNALNARPCQELPQHKRASARLGLSTLGRTMWRATTLSPGGATCIDRFYGNDVHALSTLQHARPMTPPPSGHVDVRICLVSASGMRIGPLPRSDATANSLHDARPRIPRVQGQDMRRPDHRRCSACQACTHTAGCPLNRPVFVWAIPTETPI